METVNILIVVLGMLGAFYMGKRVTQRSAIRNEKQDNPPLNAPRSLEELEEIKRESEYRRQMLNMWNFTGKPQIFDDNVGGDE